MNRRTVYQLCISLGLASAALGQTYNFPIPSHDRWHYPFNFSGGARTTGSCFGATGDFPFNDRDAAMVVAWNTGAIIPAGLGAGNYSIKLVIVTLTNQNNASWPIDLTTDEWFTYDHNADDLVNGDGIPRGQPGDTDGESSDSDAGRPIELFGAGFGPFFTLQSWTENSIYVGSDEENGSPRDPFPFVYQDVSLTPLHVEDNVKGLHNGSLPQPVFQFTPTPWALGNPINYTPGSQPIPFDVQFQIDLTLSDGAVRQYFQNQLNVGKVAVVVTSLREADFQGPQAGFPSFYMKEVLSLPVPPVGAKPPHLAITLCSPVEPDFDRDCDVDGDDFEHLRLCTTRASVGPPAPGCSDADFDDDNDVDHDDFGVLQRCISGSGVEPEPDCAGL